MDPCTEDIKTGTPQQCNVACSHQPTTRPSGGDHCCPPGANAGNDSDCPTKCGDGAVTGDETCDPMSGQACENAQTCLPNGCMGATLTGDATKCTSKCERRMITARAAGDDCCPSGANQANDSDCPQKCGDGARTGTETCDPCTDLLLTCNPVGCADAKITGSISDCTATCMRGTVTEPKPGDGCCPRNANTQTDSDCRPMCGDGVVSTGEDCDNGSGSPTRCPSTSICENMQPAAGGSCPRLTGSGCNAKCTFDGAQNQCGGCKPLDTKYGQSCTPMNDNSCTTAAWTCPSQISAGGSKDTVTCACLIRN